MPVFRERVRTWEIVFWGYLAMSKLWEGGPVILCLPYTYINVTSCGFFLQTESLVLWEMSAKFRGCFFCLVTPASRNLANHCVFVPSNESDCLGICLCAMALRSSVSSILINLFVISLLLKAFFNYLFLSFFCGAHLGFGCSTWKLSCNGVSVYIYCAWINNGIHMFSI